MSDLIIENGIVRSCQEKLSLTITIPPGVKAIDNGVFSGMQNLISINFPASLNYIGDSAFQGCKKLTEINLSGINHLGDQAFMGCSSLKSVIIGKNLPFICNSTFLGCSSLAEIDLPENITYIGCEAFKDCTSLAEVNMNAVMEIDNNAFEGCTELYSIILPSTLIHIAPNAFSFCRNLGTVTFCTRFVDIDETAFDYTVNMVFKAVQNSSAYNYSRKNNKIIFQPIILNRDALEITTEQLEMLKNSDVIFMSKPAPNAADKAFIVFDESQRSTIIKIIGG